MRPDRPPGRENDSGPDATPGRQETPLSPEREVVSSVARGVGGRICPRCGGVIEETTDVDLVLCTALARGAVEERASAGLCPACAAGLAS